MPKVIAYTQTGPELPVLIEFAIDRGYHPNQAAEGDISQVIKQTAKGDTLIVETLEVFNLDGWGGAVILGDLIKAGVTVVSRLENAVLKDDMQSTVIMAMTCMTIMLKTQGLPVSGSSTVTADEDKTV